jgi:hypothetical protein
MTPDVTAAIGKTIAGSWTWTDALLFAGVFVAIRFATIWMATKMFIAMIPDGDCCPICDSVTLPIARDGWWKILGPRFRRSWCLGCGWEGVLRRTEPARFYPSRPPLSATKRSHSGQLPLSSKKSSK